MNKDHAIKWATNTLVALGISVLQPPEVARNMPWSKVTRFYTSQGIFYLKEMSEQFAVEPLVLTLLLNEMAAPVPEVIAHDAQSRYFLMLDAGGCLRDKLKSHYDTTLVSNILKSYSEIQIQTINKRTKLLSLGVKDWRLNQLPLLYLNLLAQENLLLNDGLTFSEIEQLKQYHAFFVEDCARLAAFGLPETLEHGDFHDNNILIDNHHKVTLNDWGDANITHPFFSLGSWLDSASRHHQLNTQDPRYELLIKAYLEPWQRFAPYEALLAAFMVSERLRPILFSINFCRVTSCEGMEKLGQFKGYIAQALKEYIVIYETYKKTK